MRLNIAIVDNANGSADAKIDFCIEECIAFFSVNMDAPTCRSFAAQLLQVARDIDNRVWTPQRGKVCPVCIGNMPEFEQVAEKIGGQWVHLAKGKNVDGFLCLTPPLILNPNPGK